MIQSKIALGDQLQKDSIQTLRKSMLFSRERWVKIIAFFFLSCFAFSSVVEARQVKALRQSASVKKQSVALKKADARTAVTKTRHSQAKVVKTRPQRVVAARKHPRSNVSSNRAHTRTVVSRQKQHNRHPVTPPPLPIQALLPSVPPVSVTPPPLPLQALLPSVPPVSVTPPPLPIQALLPIAPPIPVDPVLSYLSQLPAHTQRNAEIVELTKLYALGAWGQGMTIAPIDQSGTWKYLRDVINNPYSLLTPERRENYRKHFLPAIGGPNLHPDEKNAWIRICDPGFHGADVSSVVLDLAPQTKVLPVSTYDTPGSPDFYDVADAVMDLAQRPDVNIINISAGHVHFTSPSKDGYDANGKLIYVYKTVYTPKFAEAFRAAAQAGKVIVLAAGNGGEDIKPPEFTQSTKMPRSQIMGHLVEALDPETLESVFFAGNLDPETGTVSKRSNKPGPWETAQKRFAVTPGSHELPDVKGLITKGTSFSSPLFASGIAVVASAFTAKHKAHPPLKVIGQALLDTADPRESAEISGCGVMRAKKAFDRLEEMGY